MPSALLSVWATGVALGGAVVAWWNIVGRGFDWLIAGTAASLAALAAWTGAGPWMAAAAALAGAAFVVGGRRLPVVVTLGLAGIAAYVAARELSGFALATSGSLAMGGISVEMLLGHWFLVDPRLPRRALVRLSLVGVAGAVADLVISFMAGIPTTLGAALTGGLGFTTIVLMVLVTLALRERGYSGVMSATGLSYLAILTGAGALAAGRAASAGAFGGF